VEEARKAGADGFLSKATGPRATLIALLQIAGGEFALGNQMAT
jgi:DNA-binding NarL/FixJ family response regulator